MSLTKAVLELAQEGPGPDGHGYREAFIDLVKRTMSLLER